MGQDFFMKFSSPRHSQTYSYLKISEVALHFEARWPPKWNCLPLKVVQNNATYWSRESCENCCAEHYMQPYCRARLGTWIRSDMICYQLEIASKLLFLVGICLIAVCKGKHIAKEVSVTVSYTHMWYHMVTLYIYAKCWNGPCSPRGDAQSKAMFHGVQNSNWYRYIFVCICSKGSRTRSTVTDVFL